MKNTATILLLLLAGTATAQATGDYATWRKASGVGDTKTYTTTVNDALWSTGSGGSFALIPKSTFLTPAQGNAAYSLLGHTHTFASLTSPPTTLAGYGITDAVPSSRTLTINGTALDLSANRSWTISPGGSNTQVQYNSSGAFAGSNSFTFNPAGGGLLTAPYVNVDNDLAVAGALSIGLDFSVSSDPGDVGEVLRSQGAGAAPVWGPVSQGGNGEDDAGKVVVYSSTGQITAGTDAAASIIGINSGNDAVQGSTSTGTGLYANVTGAGGNGVRVTHAGGSGTYLKFGIGSGNYKMEVDLDGGISWPDGGDGPETTRNNMLPDQTGNSGEYLTTDGTNVSWAAVSGGVSDGDKGDITVSGSGATWNIDAGVVTTTELGGDITAAGEALLDDANASAQRTTLGLGTAATANTGTGASDVPTITNADARYLNRLTASLTSDFTTSSASYVDVTGLTVTLEANSVYQIMVSTPYTSTSTSTGIGISLTATGSPTVRNMTRTLWSNNTAPAQATHNSDDTGAILTTVNNAGTVYGCTLLLTFNTAGSSSVVQIRAARGGSNNNVSVKSGSSIIAIKL